VDIRAYKLISVLTTALMGFAVGYSASQKDPFLGLIAVSLGIVILKIARKRVDEVLEDERIVRISEKASRKAFEISTIFLALLSLILISQNLEIGYALGFAICGMLVLYVILYALYSSRPV